jgi:hypothetical protein
MIPPYYKRQNQTELVALALQCTGDCQMTDVRGQRSKETIDFTAEINPVGFVEDQRPAFELGDASIGFAGLRVDGIEFFIDAIKPLLAAVRKFAT